MVLSIFSVPMASYATGEGEYYISAMESNSTGPEDLIQESYGYKSQWGHFYLWKSSGESVEKIDADKVEWKSEDEGVAKVEVVYTNTDEYGNPIEGSGKAAQVNYIGVGRTTITANVGGAPVASFDMVVTELPVGLHLQYDYLRYDGEKYSYLSDGELLNQEEALQLDEGDVIALNPIYFDEQGGGNRNQQRHRELGR